MRPGLADFSPTVPAAFAVGIGISLSVFLLPAGVVDKGPTPRVPAFGGAAGHVVADLPVAGRRASKVRKAAPEQPQLVVVLRPPATKTRRTHHRARTVIVPRAPSAPVRAVAPAAPSTPVTRTQLFSMPPKAKGKALGHARRDQQNQTVPAPLSAGRGNALGHSNEHEDRLPPGRAKKASPASAPGPSPRPEGNRGRNGHKGNGGGNGHKGNGGGNGSEGNGGGNGRKWEKE